MEREAALDELHASLEKERAEEAAAALKEWQGALAKKGQGSIDMLEALCKAQARGEASEPAAAPAVDCADFVCAGAPDPLSGPPASSSPCAAPMCGERCSRRHGEDRSARS